MWCALTPHSLHGRGCCHVSSITVACGDAGTQYSFLILAAICCVSNEAVGMYCLLQADLDVELPRLETLEAQWRFTAAERRLSDSQPLPAANDPVAADGTAGDALNAAMRPPAAATAAALNAFESALASSHSGELADLQAESPVPSGWEAEKVVAGADGWHETHAPPSGAAMPAELLGVLGDDGVVAARGEQQGAEKLCDVQAAAAAFDAPGAASSMAAAGDSRAPALSGNDSPLQDDGLL